MWRTSGSPEEVEVGKRNRSLAGFVAVLSGGCQSRGQAANSPKWEPLFTASSCTIIKNTYQLFHRPKSSTVMASLWQKRISHHISHLLIQRPLLERHGCGAGQVVNLSEQRNIICLSRNKLFLWGPCADLWSKIYIMINANSLVRSGLSTEHGPNYTPGRINPAASSCRYGLTLKDLMNAPLPTANNSTHASKTLCDLLRGWNISGILIWGSENWSHPQSQREVQECLWNSK